MDDRGMTKRTEASVFGLILIISDPILPLRIGYAKLHEWIVRESSHLKRFGFCWSSWEPEEPPGPGFELAESAHLPSGSIYPILARLEKARWLDSQSEDINPSKEGRRPRRYSRLTSTGLVSATNAVREASKFFAGGQRAWANS